jgi:putative ABC transport system permease protein
MPEWKPEILRRLAPLKLASTREAEIAEELSQHLEDRYQELLASAQPEDAAFRAALDELKDEDLLTYELKPVEKNFSREPIVPGKASKNFFADLLQDVRYAFRMLHKSPGFTTTAVLTLALGIGATTAIFSVVNAVLLHALPYHNSNRLMLVREKLPQFSPRPIAVSVPDVAVMARENRVFTGVAAFTGRQLNLSGAGAPERLVSARVSANLFPLLDASPAIGRIFHEGEDQPGHFVTVVSYGLWQRRFGGEASAVGRSITLDGQSYTIIGVMPKGFEFPPRGLLWY